MQDNRSNQIRTASGQEFTVQAADVSDARLIYKLLVEAADWMVGNGINQWKPEDFTLAEIKGYFAERELYIVYGNGEAAGMFTLQDSDPSYWHELNDTDYYYLHRLNVREPFRGKGLSQAILDWAFEKSALDGKKGLRLDCRANNPKLIALYQKYHFERVVQREKQGIGFQLFERNC